MSEEDYAVAFAANNVLEVERVGRGGVEAESGARLHLRALLSQLTNSNASDAEVGLAVGAVADTATQCVGRSLLSTTLPVQLFADAFDQTPLANCDALFRALDARRTNPDWGIVFADRAALNLLLLLTNDLLRRLSKTLNTVFAGRILIFLSLVFPLSEKSGCNIKGAFNFANMTDFDTAETTGSLDSVFHKKFWSLQKWFNNPSLCFQKTAWDEMSLTVDVVLSAFESNSLANPSTATLADAELPTTTTTTTSIDFYPTTTALRYPKYLTSRNLLQLELADVQTRRAILIQLLIVCNYWLNNNANPKAKATKLDKPAEPIRSTLSEQQRQWISGIETRATNLLQENSSSSHQFKNSIVHVIDRENNWTEWKHQGCLSYERSRLQPAPAPADSTATSGAAPVVKKRKRDENASEGISRLWNSEEANQSLLIWLKDKSKNHVPQLREYFEEAALQLDPEQQVDEEYKLVNDSNWVWRGLRLISKTRLSYFQTIGNAGEISKAITDMAQAWNPSKAEDSIMVAATSNGTSPTKGSSLSDSKMELVESSNGAE